MYNLSSKTGISDALTLAAQIVRNVNAAMPIGAENLKQDPHGFWAYMLVGAVQEGSLVWVSTLVDGKRTWKSVLSTEKEYLVVPTYDIDEDTFEIVDRALDTSMFKAGNCTEMSSLAMAYLCQRIAAIPDNTPVPSFSFKRIAGIGEVINHAFVLVLMGNDYVLCDPWLDRVYEVNDENLKKWKTEFEAAEIPSDTKQAMSPEDQASIWDGFINSLKRRDIVENVECVVSSREHAKEIVDLYDRSLQEAVLSLYNEKLFDERNMSSVLRWHEKPVQLYLLEYAKKTSLSYYQKKNIEAIKRYIENYEFPLLIYDDEVLENIHLYVYLFSNSDFTSKPSNSRIVRFLQSSPYEIICRSCETQTDSMVGLKIYAAKTLAHSHGRTFDRRAMALREAFLSNSLVGICDALKMKTEFVHSFWSEADPWEAMPQKLKSAVERKLREKNRPQ